MNRTGRSLLVWPILCWLGLLLSLPARAVSPEPVAVPVYSFAVVPQYTPLTAHRLWRPFVEQLSKDTGIQFKLQLYSNFNKFLDDLDSGRSDFAYMAPYHLVLAKRAQGYSPLLRDGGAELVGLVLVKKESPYRSIQDLNGKQIDFPSPNAFAASLYLRAYLQEHEKIEFTTRYLGNHDNVYRHLVHGFSEAGGGVNTTLARQPQALQDRLRVLFQVPPVSSHPIATHPRVSNEVRQKVINAVMAWGNDANRKQLLELVQIEKPMIADYQRDYKALEDLNLDKYLVEAGAL